VGATTIDRMKLRRKVTEPPYSADTRSTYSVSTQLTAGLNVEKRFKSVIYE